MGFSWFFRITHLHTFSDSLGDTVLLVESKFWAPLTQNQPVSYLSYLSSNYGGLVVILGPESRYKTLWPKIIELCEEAKLYPSEVLGSPPHQISVRLTPKSRLGYLSWGYLLEDFQSILDNEGNLRGSNEVWQLLALTERLEAEAFQPFIPEELLSGSDTRINQLKSIINAVVENLNEAGYIDYKGYRATPGAGYYKRYFTFLDHINWYIEYNEHRSQRFRISLIFLGGPKTEDLAISSLSSEMTHTSRIIEDGNEILIPLNIPLGVEESDVNQSLFDQVESIVEMIGRIKL